MNSRELSDHTESLQVSIHDDPEHEEYLLVMKGAPERILERSKTILLDGEEVDMNEQLRLASSSLNFGGEHR